MSADELHDWRYLIEDNTLPVNKRLRIARSIYDTAYERGKASADRPHGEWIEEKPKTAEERAFYGRAIYRCSNCKKISDVRYHAPFCECCGADMREGEQNE